MLDESVSNILHLNILRSSYALKDKPRNEIQEWSKIIVNSGKSIFFYYHLSLCIIEAVSLHHNNLLLNLTIWAESIGKEKNWNRTIVRTLPRRIQARKWGKLENKRIGHIPCWHCLSLNTRIRTIWISERHPPLRGPGEKLVKALTLDEDSIKYSMW